MRAGIVRWKAFIPMVGTLGSFKCLSRDGNDEYLTLAEFSV